MSSVQLKSNKALGELIHYYRLIKGYSQKDLAKKLHVTISAISSWERGQNKPGLDVAMMIAEDIGISLDEFFLTRKANTVQAAHHLSDQITMANAYVEISDLKLTPDKRLALTLRIKGLSLTLEMIDYYSRQLKVWLDNELVSIQSTIVQLDDETISISPELKAITQPVRCFECVTEMAYHPYQDVEMRLMCHEQEERYVIPGSTIRLLHEDHPMNHKTTHQQELLLNSSDHKEVLQYLAKSNNPNSLQEYVKRLYF
jgi:transcriptional regulator with XRE-family HTH domain